jgi:DNA-binding CsgD family transcriptional regulator
MHGRAALLLSREGRPVDELATHLLESEPAEDAWVVETLRRAATQALAKGAPELAVTYLRRAHKEPPAPAVRAEVLAELAASEAAALDPMAIEDLTRALEVTEDPRRSAALALALARLLARQGRPSEAIATLERAIGRIGPQDREVTLHLEAELILYLFINEPTRTSSWKRLDRFQLDDEPDGLGKRLLMADMAGRAGFRCEPVERTAALALGALADWPAMVKHAGGSGLLPSVFSALTWCDCLQDAERILDACLSQATATGSVFTVSSLLPFRAEVARRRGDLVTAEAYGRQGLAIARSYDIPTDLCYAVAMLVMILIERGELDEAATSMAQLPAKAELGDQLHSAWLWFARGCYRLARCQPADALDELLESGKRYLAYDCVNPAVVPWRSTAALACAALGQLERARTLVDEELVFARAFGAPRAIGIAQRAAGLLEKGRRAVELLEETVATLKQSCGTLELARAQIDYGAALRRCGQRSAAVEALRQGLDLADRCRATPLVARARAELIAAGARPRRHRLTGLEALTASEHRIAEMVAQGLSNRQIAQQLFISMKTVSIHLTHAYQKLGISTRTELQQILASSR